MTAHQAIRQWLADRDRQAGDGDSSDGVAGGADPWDEAPAPAQVGRRLIEGLLRRPVLPSAITMLTRVMHWSYGTLWGAVYAVARESLRSRARLPGPVFGAGVWAASYAQLVPLGIYEPPWRYPLGSLADELGYHLTYGTTVAKTYELTGGAGTAI